MKHAISFALAALLLAACNKPTPDEQALPKSGSISSDAGNPKNPRESVVQMV